MNKNKLSILNMWLTIVIIIAILYTLPVLSFFNRKNTSSFFENRNLATFPVASVDSIKDGSFFTACEDYMIDHIYKRDKWMTAYTSMNLYSLKKPAVNRIVLADDLLLPLLDPIPPFHDYDDLGVRTAKDLAKLKDAVESPGGKLLVMGVPEQYSVLRVRYPYPLFNNDVNLSAMETTFFGHLSQGGIDSINMRPYYEVANDSTCLYAKTDHHYRLEGAYLAYDVLCKKLHEMGFSFPVTTEEDFDYIQLPNDFLGSRAKKLYGLSPVTEKTQIYKLKKEIPFTRYDNGKLVESSVFTLPPSDGVPVEYLIYMGGDIAETVIRTDRPELPNVLIFGNSYTNALETFLYTSFNETRSLDLRYYNEKGILEYIETYRPDIVIHLEYDLGYLLQSGNGVIE